MAKLTIGPDDKQPNAGLSEIQDLFKEQFAELISLLSACSGNAALARMAGEKVFSNEDVNRLDDANDELEKMLVSYKVLAATDLARLMKDSEVIINNPTKKQWQR